MAKKKFNRDQISAQDLFIVDCLLPGQVRQLGGNFTYLSPRRAVRSSARDCAVRGGEFVAYDRANLKSALKIWMPQAKDGDAAAQVYVARIYERTAKSNADYAKAVSWYQKAVKQGHNGAMISLGNLYEKGQGIERNVEKALNLYRRAAGLSEGSLEISTEEERRLRQEQAEENEVLRTRVTRLSDNLRATNGALKDSKRQLQANRTKMAATRALLDKQAGETEATRASAQKKLARLAREIKRKTEEIDRYQATASNLIASLGFQEGALPGDGKPGIQVIAPEIITTRGIPSATIVSSVEEYDVVGKVSLVGDLATFRINDEDARDYLGPNGVFNFPMLIDSEEIPVSIEVITKDGSRTVQDFLINKQKPQALEKRVTSKRFRKQMKNDLGDFYALVIGNNNYQNYLKLETAVNDAEDVAKVLRDQYGYKTSLLIDATLDQIVRELARLTDELGKYDNLLIYYAGHGVIDEKTGDGFWLPVDAQSTDRKQWLSNHKITDFLAEMKAKHVLVVADSCYSGTLSGSAIRPLPLEIEDKDLMFISRVKARTVLTSGGLQPVVDSTGGKHSIFAEAFLNSLRNVDGLLETYRVYQDVRQQVRRNATLHKLSQTPEYSALNHAGHEGAEFFFLPKRALSASLPQTKEDRLLAQGN